MVVVQDTLVTGEAFVDPAADVTDAADAHAVGVAHGHLVLRHHVGASGHR